MKRQDCNSGDEHVARKLGNSMGAHASGVVLPSCVLERVSMGVKTV